MPLRPRPKNYAKAISQGIAAATAGYNTPSYAAWTNAYNAATGGGKKTFNPNTQGPPLRGKKLYKKRKGKGKVRTKTNNKLSKDVNQIKSSIRQLKLVGDQSTGLMTYRSIANFQLKTNRNLQNSVWFSSNPISTYNTVLENLKFFNPDDPSTLTTASGVAGNYQRNTLFTSVTQKIQYKNNYQSDCKIKVYLCMVKDDTSINPEVAWTNGIAGATNETSNDAINMYPTDINQVVDLWKLKVVLDTTLSPGQSGIVSHTEKNIQYDISTTDNHALEYQTEYKGFGFLTVIQGGIGHSNNETCFMKCGLDMFNTQIYKVKYDAGVNITFVVNNHDFGSPTDPETQSNCPANDNQAYDE